MKSTPYKDQDLAKKYKQTHSSASKSLPADVVKADLHSVATKGYVIIENLLSVAEVQKVKAACNDLLDYTGRNDFEGLKTQRVYAVLSKTRAIDRLVDHPRILALLDNLLMPNYLLSQAQIINILPGESAQGLHTDDEFYPLRRPRKALGAATVWAIDDFTEENGATSIIPKSHLWGDDQVADRPQAIPAAMPAGSVVFYPATLWHGGGANFSSHSRLAVTCQYCEPWVRTQENYFLSTPLEVVNEVSEDIRRMLGYSIHPPFIGMVNGMHPKRLLEDI
jgi:hypothetical protein